MTWPGTATERPQRAAHWLLAGIVGLAVVLAGIVVGAVPAAAQNAVGASTPVMINTVGPAADIGAGQRLGKTVLHPVVVVATGVAAETVTTSERVSGPLWTSTKSDSAAANALRHFNDHGSDFAGLNNALEYVADAQSFLRSPPAGTLTRLRANGDVVRYNPQSNIFGVMDRTGAPRTFFKPDPAVHGCPTNLDYFNAQ